MDLLAFIFVFWLGGVVSILGNFIVVDAGRVQFGPLQLVMVVFLSLVWPVGLLVMGARKP